MEKILTDIEKLKVIQKMKDKMVSVYDEYRFNSENINYDNFKKIKEVQIYIDVLINDYVESLPLVQKVIATEDIIIEPGVTTEIKTNITGLQIENIDFDGYIPTDGYLDLTSLNEESSVSIYVRNNVPISVFEEYDICGYHYSDPTTTKYFWTGVYKIEKGTTIGIAFMKQISKDNGNQYVNKI